MPRWRKTVAPQAIELSAEPADNKLCWPIFDCRKNAWVGVELGGADPVDNRDFNNSMGLMYDPARKLISSSRTRRGKAGLVDFGSDQKPTQNS
jgi:hypothetical protein